MASLLSGVFIPVLHSHSTTLPDPLFTKRRKRGVLGGSQEAREHKEERSGGLPPLGPRGSPSPMSLTSLGTAPYLAIELFQDGGAVLGALLVVAHHPQLFGGEGAKTP